jgi:hypothetical protein
MPVEGGDSGDAESGNRRSLALAFNTSPPGCRGREAFNTSRLKAARLLPCLRDLALDRQAMGHCHTMRSAPACAVLRPVSITRRAHCRRFTRGRADCGVQRRVHIGPEMSWETPLHAGGLGRMGRSQTPIGIPKAAGDSHLPRHAQVAARNAFGCLQHPSCRSRLEIGVCDLRYPLLLLVRSTSRAWKTVARIRRRVLITDAEGCTAASRLQFPGPVTVRGRRGGGRIGGAGCGTWNWASPATFGIHSLPADLRLHLSAPGVEAPRRRLTRPAVPESGFSDLPGQALEIRGNSQRCARLGSRNDDLLFPHSDRSAKTHAGGIRSCRGESGGWVGGARPDTRLAHAR